MCGLCGGKSKGGLTSCSQGGAAPRLPQALQLTRSADRGRGGVGHRRQQNDDAKQRLAIAFSNGST